MLQLGIVGTNWITHQFVEAALSTGEYQLAGIFSRTSEHGEDFAAHYPALTPAIFTDWEKFCQSDGLDVVYLASPNSLHFTQARDLISAGKNVIVEKPAFTTVAEMAEIVALAKQNKCFYFEAARHIHEPGLQKLAELMPDSGELVSADLNYAKYSSRYPAVLAGETPNIFSPKFSGGALMDLGVYAVYFAVFLFGVPKDAHYFATMLKTGVDGNGTIVLDYGTFNVTATIGKTFDSFRTSEIYTTTQTFSIYSLTLIDEINIFSRGEDAEKISLPHAPNPMLYEAQTFAMLMKNPNDPELQTMYRVLVQLSQNVNATLNKLRQSAGLVFAADLKE